MDTITDNDRAVFAACAGNLPLLRERIEAGADLNHVHPLRGSLLHAASKHPVCIAYLLQQGCDPNAHCDQRGYTALDAALEWTAWGYAESAWLLHRAGAKATRLIIETPVTDEQVLLGKLWIDWAWREYCIGCGTLIFGSIHNRRGQWCFSDTAGSSGCFYRIVALSDPELKDIVRIEPGESCVEPGFVLVGHRERRFDRYARAESLELDAVVSLNIS